MITIIDYGCGNINAFVNVFKRLNVQSNIATKMSDLNNCKKIILPGVGSYDHVMTQFNKSGLRQIVEEKVLEENIPVLGICAGMQILGNFSEEGSEKGLGWINGSVKKFDVSKIEYKTKLPHMGWNNISHNNNKLFSYIPNNSKFYFVHSYYFSCNDIDDSIATSYYGDNFTCSVNKNNIYGVQFHPEKSHLYGQILIKNFIDI